MKTADQWSVWLKGNFHEMSLSERNKIIDFANMEETKTTTGKDQRVIRFRAWDLANERMFDDPVYFHPITAGHYVDQYNAPFVFFETWQDIDDGIDRPCHIMQNTGLKDKEGKEIYDQDILQFGSAIGKIVWFFDGWQIEWITQNEGLRNRADKLSTKISTKKLLKSVLLGNAFQNPELLK